MRYKTYYQKQSLWGVLLKSFQKSFINSLIIKVDLKFQQRPSKKMRRILSFSQLPGQYWLFVIPFHVQTNFSRFVEHTLAKSWWWKLISYILPNKNKEIFSFFFIFISFRLKNINTVRYSFLKFMFKCSRNLLVKF